MKIPASAVRSLLCYGFPHNRIKKAPFHIPHYTDPKKVRKKNHSAQTAGALNVPFHRHPHHHQRSTASGKIEDCQSFDHRPPSANLQKTAVDYHPSAIERQLATANGGALCPGLHPLSTHSPTVMFPTVIKPVQGDDESIRQRRKRENRNRRNQEKDNNNRG